MLFLFLVSFPGQAGWDKIPSLTKKTKFDRPLNGFVKVFLEAILSGTADNVAMVSSRWM